GVETEVRAFVRDPLREHAAREAEALARREDGLVGQVDDDLSAGEVADDRNTVFLAAAELLRSAREPHAHHLVRQRSESVANHGRIVLAVDDDDRSHRRAVTSPSIRAVYFSNSSVSTRNWMIFSCP